MSVLCAIFGTFGAFYDYEYGYSYRYGYEFDNDYVYSSKVHGECGSCGWVGLRADHDRLAGSCLI